MQYYKDEVKRYEDQNDMMLNNMPENNEDFIELDLDPKQ